MIDHSERPFEDVLDMLLAEFQEPSRQAVAAFSERYPEHRADLLAFAACWAEQEHLPEAAPLGVAREERIETRAAKLLDAKLTELVGTKPRTVSQLIAASNRPLDEIAATAGLDVPLVHKLIGNRIRPETIPSKVAARIAGALRVDVGALIASLSLPSTMPAAAAFMSPGVQLPTEDFKEAVEASSLSAEEKATLL